MRVPPLLLFVLSLQGVFLQKVGALTFFVDYRYDTNNFFDTQEKKDAMQAVVDRWGAIIDQSLTEVNLVDDGRDARISFSHPGLGGSFQVSSAESQATDAAAGGSIADEYRGAWSIPADTLIIYAGGRPLNTAGVGGTGTGLNFTSTFNDPVSVLNRGFNVGVGTLPVWGGSIAFDSEASWHFDLNTTSPFEKTDFYSIALHEIGHVLGLATSWDDWEANVDLAAAEFMGPNAVAAFNTDNGTSMTELALVSSSDGHWEDNEYDSVIFPAGNPLYLGTVGEGNLQDLLMEPIANFFTGVRDRFEVTNIDVGALQDIGWSVISSTSFSPLEQWRQTHFGITTNSGDAANDFDFDGDGLVNLLEYGLGTIPVTPDPGPIEGSVSSGRFQIEFPYAGGSSDIRILVEESPDLRSVSWVEIAEADDGGIFQALSSGVDAETSATNAVVSSERLSGRGFLRVKVIEK